MKYNFYNYVGFLFVSLNSSLKNNVYSYIPQEFEWSEVEKKTDRECRWLVIDDEVYNITSWSYRHPGGSKVIAHYAGQDATVSTADR